MVGDVLESESATSRRGVLKAAAAASALGGLAGVGRAQSEAIELDGDVAGWVGRSPDTIAGETNPTLTLEPGRTYRVTWTNVDGLPHSFVVESADGNRLAGTEVMSEEGATRTAEFEATPAMAEYYCEVHPQSMRGQVSVGGETTDGTETGDTETTENGPPPVIAEETIVLGARAEYWLGLAPSGIQGRPNPTLRLRAGQEYELVWMNLDGADHDFHLTDASGEDIADTSDRDDVGDTHDTSFEATSEMAEYYCEFHPQSMRGGVESV